MKTSFIYNGNPTDESGAGASTNSERLDLILARWAKSAESAGAFFGYSRAKCARLIEDGLIIVDRQQVLRPAYLPRLGAVIEVLQPTDDGDSAVLLPDSNVLFTVIFEDDAVIVVNKPANLVVHPGAGKERATLVHGLLAHYGLAADSAIRKVGAPTRPGIVHRLDKDTTGLMVVAKTEHAYQHLINQFRSCQISREYIALTIAVPRAETESGEIASRLTRSERDRTRFVTSSNRGKEARTSWRVRERYRKGALLELRLATGRTHQIRVHLASVGAPIVGDQTYGPTAAQIPTALRGIVNQFRRQALHAERLRFVHPSSGDEVEFYAEAPADMQQLLEAFRVY